MKGLKKAKPVRSTLQLAKASVRDRDVAHIGPRGPGNIGNSRGLWHIAPRGRPLPKPTLGSTVGGKYKLLRALGEGGMGTVYEVEHLLTHKRAAIKWVHPQTGSSDSAHDRLLHEARATSRIHHRNVVDVYDVLREDDAVCLVMQLLVGEPLSDLIARGPMPFTEFVALLLPAMRGVAAAHAAGVIHRDIKPDNIFLTKESGQPEIVPKVIDFGISKVFDPKSPHQLTRSGITMGTPKYVSYEQLLGARDVDGRADVYAFGVMLYEAITGEPPYRAGTFGEQAVAFAMSVPARPSVLRPQIPAALDVVVYRAIAKEREQRVGSIEALITELEPFLDARAYPEPMLAFVENKARRLSGAPEPHEPTAPAMATPSSKRSEEVPELRRLSPTPRAPVSLATPVQVGRGRLPRTRHASAVVLACAAALLGLLVWWFQVPRQHPASLPAAHAESVAHREVPPQVPVPRPKPVDSASTAAESMPPIAATRPLTLQAGPAQRAPRTEAAPAGRVARKAPAAQRPEATNSAARSQQAAPRQESPFTPTKVDPVVPETHRAGRLARDEF